MQEIDGSRTGAEALLPGVCPCPVVLLLLQLPPTPLEGILCSPDLLGRPAGWRGCGGLRSWAAWRSSPRRAASPVAWAWGVGGPAGILPQRRCDCVRPYTCFKSQD